MLETRANSVGRTVCDYPCIACDPAVMMEAFTDATRDAMKYMGSGCWLQWNAATECDVIVMLPLAEFPMHYDPAARCNQFCHLNGSLDCQIQRSAAVWRPRSVRIVRNSSTIPKIELPQYDR
jgi:hypothetical protein